MFIFLIIGAAIVVGTAAAQVAGPVVLTSKIIKAVGRRGFPEGAGPLSAHVDVCIAADATTSEGQLLFYLAQFHTRLAEFTGKTFRLYKPELDALNSLLMAIALAIEKLPEGARAEFCREATNPVESILRAVISGAKLSFRKVFV